MRTSNTKQLKKMKIKMSLISKGINVVKICNEKEAWIFERDQPSKYGLLFSKTPYAIGKKILQK